METGLLADEIFSQHDPGRGHPESPGRHAAVWDRLEEDGVLTKFSRIPARVATDGELERCHDPEYVALVVNEITSGVRTLSTGDTDVCEDSLEVARRATGGMLNAVDALFAGELKNAFCATRPPGHHATPGRGMGFCIFNHVAAAARHAQVKHGAERVAIIDWDVHHGNGTQDIFYDDPEVFYFSTHQSPWYPGTGAASERGQGRGEGTTLNVPVAAGGGMGVIGEAFRERFLPAMDAFKPDLVLVSAGFDSRIGDPLGNLELTDADFAELTRMLLDLAGKYAGGRLVSVLEGGYNVSGLASAVSAHVGELAKA